jgi:hypothetical protein
MKNKFLIQAFKYLMLSIITIITALYIECKYIVIVIYKLINNVKLEKDFTIKYLTIAVIITLLFLIAYFFSKKSNKYYDLYEKSKTEE